MTRRIQAHCLTGIAVVTTAILCFATTSAHSQSHPIAPLGETHPMVLESGPRMNLTFEEQVVFADVVRLEGVAWMRLHMSELQLEGDSRIRYTSLFDGDVQEMDAVEAAMWSYTSAYFNGDAVLVELIAAPGTTDNHLALDHVEVELLEEGTTLSFCGICFNSDDRIPSDVDFAGRLMNPGICSAMVYNSDSCIVTAGHCVSGSSQVIQFRVPDSLSNCNIQHPPSLHQYPLVTVVESGSPYDPGTDWAVATTGTSQGMTIVERYGEYRPLASSVPSSGNIDIWGFGASKICVRNHVQQLSQGPITGVNNSTIFHRADTTGGNSGSGIVHNDEIIGVVTHCTTSCPPGSNVGTRIDLTAFQNAINSLCPPDPPVPPDNNECQDRILVTDGITPFDTTNATTEGPAESGCTFFGDPQIHRDVWYDYTATCTGELTVDLCDSAMTTKLAVYAGTTCPTAPDTADGCDVTGCPSNRSIVTMDVTEGEDFIIRVGGRLNQTGTGVLQISCEEVTAPDCPSDLNDDGEVDALDLLILLSDWGPCPGCDSDLNDDDEVDALDLLILLSDWGSCP